MKYKLLTFIAFLFLLSACKTPQGARAGKLKDRSAEYVQRAMIENQFNAERLNLKAKIKFADEERSMTVFSNIRMRKDSVIWLNAKAFGIEAGRVLIKPDSIFVLDRINKTYMAKDIFWLQDEFGLPVDFKGLQAMLFGNPIFFHKDLTVAKDSVSYTLAGESSRYRAQYKTDGFTFKLLEMLIAQPADKRTGFFQLSDYHTLASGQSFSRYRNIELSSPETGAARIRIEVTDAEVNGELNMPFNVSSRYRKVD